MLSKIIDSDTLDKLYENEEFCTQIGKVVLSFSKLAEQLLVLIKNEKIETNMQKPPMVMLIKYIEKKEFFPNIVPVLEKMDEANIDQLLQSVLKKSFLDDSSGDFLKVMIELEKKIKLIYTLIKEHNTITL